MRTVPYLSDLFGDMLLYLAGAYHCIGIDHIYHMEKEASERRKTGKIEQKVWKWKRRVMD